MSVSVIRHVPIRSQIINVADLVFGLRILPREEVTARYYQSSLGILSIFTFPDKVSHYLVGF